VWLKFMFDVNVKDSSTADNVSNVIDSITD